VIRTPYIFHVLLTSSCAFLCLTVVAAPAQAPITPSAPQIVVDAVKYQLDDFQHSTWGLRYRVHRQDEKEDTERDLIESREGNVARTLTRHGKPLTPEEDAAERQRLEAITAADMARRRRQTESNEKYGVELIEALPQAMLYTLTPGQPQLAQGEHTQTVYDFAPNPHFHPKTTTESVLPCLAGRVWIDSETHHLIRIEGNVVQNVNLMMGILARVYSGGTISFEQHPVGGGHYGYTRLDIDVKLRELMVKVMPYRATYNATNQTYLSSAPTFQDAVKLLLARP
jgi:hypothetical protein